MRQRPERGGREHGCSWSHGLRKLGERWGPKVHPKYHSVGQVLGHGWILRGALVQGKAPTHLRPVREQVRGEEETVWLKRKASEGGRRVDFTS